MVGDGDSSGAVTAGGAVLSLGAGFYGRQYDVERHPRFWRQASDYQSAIAEEAACRGSQFRHGLDSLHRLQPGGPGQAEQFRSRGQCAGDHG